jgi:y4mF family transcriptional regulator
MKLKEFLKSKRKAFQMTQEDLSLKAGVGLRLVRDIEQGKTNMQMDKVNQILALFGCELGVTQKQQSDD